MSANTQSQNFDLKVSLDGTTRRFSISSSPPPIWSAFSDQVKERFSVTEPIEISYVDDDGDVITLSSDIELQELWASYKSGTSFQDFRFTVNRIVPAGTAPSQDGLIADIQAAIAKDPTVIGAIRDAVHGARKGHRHHPFGPRGGKFGRHRHAHSHWHMRDPHEETSESSSESETEVADDTDKEKDPNEKEPKKKCGKHGKKGKRHHHHHHGPPPPPPPPGFFHPFDFCGPPPPPPPHFHGPAPPPFAGPSHGFFGGGRGRGGRHGGGRGGFGGWGGFGGGRHGHGHGHHHRFVFEAPEDAFEFVGEDADIAAEFGGHGHGGHSHRHD